MFAEHHPGLAGRNCEDCRQFVYGEDGMVVMDEQGQPEARSIPPDCGSCPKNGIEPMSDENVAVFGKFLTCRALGCLPMTGGLDDQDPVLVAKFGTLAYYYHQKDVTRDAAMTRMGM